MKAGQIFLTSSGEYSDYGVGGVFYVLKDFSWDERLAAFLEQHPEQRRTYGGEYHTFLAELEKGGLIEPTSIHEIHMGCYGSWECREVDKAADDAPRWVRA